MSEITKAERTELAGVVRLRMKVARTAVDQRTAELLADMEGQLAATYRVDDAAWAEVTKAAQQTVDNADQEIARLCRERGIREEFRPGLRLFFHGRGENAAADRRAELRKVAQTRIAAAARTAKAAIEAKGAEVLTELVAGALESGQARAFLASIPTAEQLMPPMRLDELESHRQVDRSPQWSEW